ncbi:MAG TPA: ribokinase [Tepidisphaeraceae bacterium]|jgi:ribokinase|nr:ribokinase [Tepidisphaeraceae bacterium]
MPKPIVVIGSVNMDLVCRTPSMPAPGETILGSNFVTVPGGKGGNQAVAAAKLGGDVHMVGRVGDDDFGARLLNGLKQHKVNVDHVTVSEGIASGIAMILVDTKGENSIVVAPGANAKVSPADVDAAEDLIAGACCVIMQLEIPLETVKHAIALCQRLGVTTILDPAPAVANMPTALFGVDVLTPNQSEAEILLGQDLTHHVTKKRVVDPKQIASELLARGPKSVVLKLGAAGAMAMDRDGEIAKANSFKVKVADTTAAGDAFTGGLAVARSEGADINTALRFATAAGALACTGFGAQAALPTRVAVENLVNG